MSNDRYRNVYLDNHSHFCTASTVEFLPLLNDDNMKLLVLNVWNNKRSQYDVMIEGFVIMPEHTHLLVRGTAVSVRKFVQYSLADASGEIRRNLERKARAGDYTAARWLETIHARANGGALGKVWKERFRCFPMDDEAAVVGKLRYMHLNPVRRGLVAEAADWPWSSDSHYSGRDCLIRIDTALSCGN